MGVIMSSLEDRKYKLSVIYKQKVELESWMGREYLINKGDRIKGRFKE